MDSENRDFYSCLLKHKFWVRIKSNGILRHFFYVHKLVFNGKKLTIINIKVSKTGLVCAHFMQKNNLLVPPLSFNKL